MAFRMNALIFAFSFLSLNLAFAQHSRRNHVQIAESPALNPRKVCCVCMTGSQPKSQIPLFKAGCRVWLAGQDRCSVVETIPLPTRPGYIIKDLNITDYSKLKLPASCDQSQELRLGFVGHGETSIQEFVSDGVEQICVPRKCDLSADFTSCNALPDPEDTLELLKKLKLPEGVKVVVSGSQCTSLGMWSSVLSGKPDLKCAADRDCPEPKWPSCDDFVGADCVLPENAPGGVIKDRSGYCIEKDGQKTLISCCLKGLKLSKAPVLTLPWVGPRIQWIRGECKPAQSDSKESQSL